MVCHTGSDIIDVCDEKMRKWRRLEGGTAIVDLKSAYLQLHVAKELWQYQLISDEGKGSETKEATDSYIDDIMVDVTKISTK